MTTSFKKTRTTAKDYGVPSEEILQTLVLENLSDYPITQINLKETISAGASFKQGSVKINEILYPNLDIVSGFELPVALATTGDKVTILYSVIIDEAPVSASTEIFSTLSYTVNYDLMLSEDTEKIAIEIYDEKLVITKSADKLAVVSSQTLSFENVIKNEGKATHTNIMFYDPIPQGITFVKGTVKIDGNTKPDYDPSVGFALDDLSPNAQITISFDVVVD